MNWEIPEVEEVRLNCEINSYTDGDFYVSAPGSSKADEAESLSVVWRSYPLAAAFLACA
jgi:hypothetical protein